MTLRLICLSFIALSIPGTSWSQSESTELVDYLRSQTAATSRLLSLARAVCPKEQFGDFSPLVLPVLTTPQAIQWTIETGNAGIRALTLHADGEPEKALDLTCNVLRQRAETAGVLDIRTFAAFNNLAIILRQSGRVAEARGLTEEMLPIVRQYPPRVANRKRTVMNTHATVLFQQGHLAQAESLYREALTNAELLGQVDPGQVAVAMSNLARLLDQRGRIEEAETWHRRVLAVRLASVGPDAYQTGGSRISLGENLTSQRKYAEAESELRQGLEIYERVFGGHHLNTAFGLDGLTQNLLQQGKTGEALPLAERALGIRRELLGPASPYTATSYYQLSRIELALGHADASLKYARAALSARLPVSSREASALNAEGREFVRQNAGSAAFQVVVAAWHALAQQRHVQEATAREIREEAFLAMQRIPLSDTGDALSLASARKLASRAGLSSLINDLEAREDRLRWLDTALARVATEGRSNSGAFSDMKAEQAKLGGQIRALNEELKSKSPDYFKQAREEPLSLGQLRGTKGTKPLLGENEALVVMTPGSGTERGYIWAVSREQVAWAELPVGPDTLKKEITQLLSQMDLAGRGVKLEDSDPALSLAFDRKAAFELYEQLFGDPRIQGVVRAKPRWIIVAHGALLATPFNALVMSAPKGSAAEDKDPAALRATHWLGLERALSFLPSVANLSTSRRKDPRAALSSTRRPLFAMGDPVFASPDASSPSRTDISTLLPLPGTRAEVDMLVRTLDARPDDVLLRVDATEAELKKRSQSGDLERARVVVFATHALLAGSLSGAVQEPALVLTQPKNPTETDDGLLTASEAAQLRFDADWIVLSACNTAGSATTDGEGLTGLARAFLFAGGDALLVSQWRLNDDSAPLLTSGALAAAAGPSPASRAESLRRSMRNLMHDSSHDGTWLPRAHPAVWAPMILVGVD